MALRLFSAAVIVMISSLSASAQTGPKSCELLFRTEVEAVRAEDKLAAAKLTETERETAFDLLTRLGFLNRDRRTDFSEMIVGLKAPPQTVTRVSDLLSSFRSSRESDAKSHEASIQKLTELVTLFFQGFAHQRDRSNVIHGLDTYWIQIQRPVTLDELRASFEAINWFNETKARKTYLSVLMRRLALAYAYELELPRRGTTFLKPRRTIDPEDVITYWRPRPFLEKQLEGPDWLTKRMSEVSALYLKDEEAALIMGRLGPPAGPLPFGIEEQIQNLVYHTENRDDTFSEFFNLERLHSAGLPASTRFDELEGFRRAFGQIAFEVVKLNLSNDEYDGRPFKVEGFEGTFTTSPSHHPSDSQWRYDAILARMTRSPATIEYSKLVLADKALSITGRSILAARKKAEDEKKNPAPRLGSRKDLVTITRQTVLSQPVEKKDYIAPSDFTRFDRKKTSLDWAERRMAELLPHLSREYAQRIRLAVIENKTMLFGFTGDFARKVRLSDGEHSVGLLSYVDSVRASATKDESNLEKVEASERARRVFAENMFETLNYLVEQTHYTHRWKFGAQSGSDDDRSVHDKRIGLQPKSNTRLRFPTDLLASHNDFLSLPGSDWAWINKHPARIEYAKLLIAQFADAYAASLSRKKAISLFNIEPRGFRGLLANVSTYFNRPTEVAQLAIENAEAKVAGLESKAPVLGTTPDAIPLLKFDRVNDALRDHIAILDLGLVEASELQPHTVDELHELAFKTLHASAVLFDQLEIVKDRASQMKSMAQLVKDRIDLHAPQMRSLDLEAKRLDEQTQSAVDFKTDTRLVLLQATKITGSVAILLSEAQHEATSAPTSEASDEMKELAATLQSVLNRIREDEALIDENVKAISPALEAAGLKLKAAREAHRA